MRTIVVTLFLFVALLRPATAAELTIPAVAGGGFALGSAMGVGEVLFINEFSASGFLAGLTLESFSFFVTSPVNGGTLVYNTAVARVTSPGLEAPGSPSYNSPIQTLQLGFFGDGPITQEVVTTIPGGFLFEEGYSYYLYLTAIASSGQAPFLIETTLSNLYPGGRGGDVNFFSPSQEISEMPHDRDVALHATFSEPTSVPEPTSAALLGVGAVALFIRQRSKARKQ